MCSSLFHIALIIDNPIPADATADRYDWERVNYDRLNLRSAKRVLSQRCLNALGLDRDMMAMMDD